MPKAKKVSYQVIPRDEAPGEEMYEMLNRLIEEHHEHLTNARIALAWNLSWQPDADGRVTLGKCKKVGDPDRELMQRDFIIMLQAEFWQDGDVSDAQREALLDHELMHAEVVYDSAGEPALDEKGRVVYRIRKHDVEEFSTIISRHGCYKRDLEDFAAALNRARDQGRLWPDDETLARRVAQDPGVRRAVEAIRPKAGSGVDSVEITANGKGVRMHADGSTERIGRA